MRVEALVCLLQQTNTASWLFLTVYSQMSEQTSDQNEEAEQTKMSLCIHSYEGCELQNSRLPASMIKPPLQIVLISGASNNRSLSHNSQSPPRTPKAKQLLDVSLSVRLDKWATIPLAAAEEGRRFKWALYPVQSKTR